MRRLALRLVFPIPGIWVNEPERLEIKTPSTCKFQDIGNLHQQPKYSATVLGQMVGFISLSMEATSQIRIRHPLFDFSRCMYARASSTPLVSDNSRTSTQHCNFHVSTYAVRRISVHSVHSVVRYSVNYLEQKMSCQLMHVHGFPR